MCAGARFQVGAATSGWGRSGRQLQLWNVGPLPWGVQASPLVVGWIVLLAGLPPHQAAVGPQQAGALPARCIWQLTLEVQELGGLLGVAGGGGRPPCWGEALLGAHGFECVVGVGRRCV